LAVLRAAVDATERGHVNSIISAHDVSKHYRIHRDRPGSLKEAVVRRGRNRTIRDFWALKDVSLEIKRGSFFGLIGHNGSGKTTLLKLMAGIHEPTSGHLAVNGRVSALLELGSGFHPELSGRENIYLNGAILGLSRKEMNLAVDGIIEFSDIGDFIDAPVKILSSGMYVRLGFAVAVHVAPEILLIDEVIAVGDEAFQRKCLEHLYELRRAGTTIVLVSHSLPLVEGLCDEVGWLDHGNLMEAGEATEVCWSYLDAVNAAEAEKLRDEDGDQIHTDTSLTEIEVRRGSGEIRIFHVDFLDGQWLANPLPSSGNALVIRLWYEAESSVTDPVFAMKLHHATGVHLASPNSALQHLQTNTIGPGRGYVDFIMEELTLLSGDYLLSTSITDRDRMHVHDAWERSHSLRIVPGSSPEREGMTDLRGTWQPPVSHEKGAPGHPNR
jgi:ABC-2 type transport system ATP-binding protein/lipopolysaccharide transport system ATP-binding protein